ncbi:NAD-dependent epimerase/dehydratase family protein [Ekhidna sp. To15]|uniref:NAD-dependent epimerase/dehydratase family protein n=1 Tax=Ekhidna sp. To15 TaxID=3395267 RepID=UPI003F51C2A9
MSNVLITGANGFLGKSLLTHLADFEISSVKLLDIHPILEDLSSDIGSEQYVLDLADQKLADCVDSKDVIIHTAWRSNPSVTGEDIEAEMELNWAASKNLIDVCIEKKAKLIFISSGGTVYGRPEYLPIDEIHPTNPVSAYGAVKLKVEEAIKEASVKSGMQYVILRPSNLYGPGFSLKKGLGVIGHWVDMIQHKQPIKMVGKGELVRDFIHIDDLCKGILSCMSVENETLNMGSGKGTSLDELRIIFEELIHRPLDIIRLEDRDFDVKTNVLSIDKIQKLTAWYPRITLSQGIKRLL